MVNYSNGKVYKIEPLNGEEGEIYIGSTTKELLSQRMTKHRGQYNEWLNGKKAKTTSFDLFEKYGIENCKIILLELVNAKSKDELISREAFFIRSLKCVNKNIPDRTKKEYREDNKDKLKEKEYRENNKDKIKENYKKYYYNNIDKLKEKNKEYKEENKDKIKEYRKEYYNNIENNKEYYKNNIDKIKENSKEYYKNNVDKIKEFHKNYYENNMDKIKEYYKNNKEKIKEYRENNKDKIKENNKEYYKNNVDKIKEYKKEYNKNNKEIIKEYDKKTYICDCGSLCKLHNKARHNKTKKHQEFISKIGSLEVPL
jgi:hypothetical protein